MKAKASVEPSTEANAEPAAEDLEAAHISDALPAWEQLYFQTLDIIDQAIEASEAELASAEKETNPLVQKDRVRLANSLFTGPLRGKKFVVHYELVGITPKKSVLRGKQEHLLRLGSATFPQATERQEVTVVISPSEARELVIGSIVRVEGELMTQSRRSFDEIALDRISRSNSGRTTSRYYSIPFYVEGVRVVLPAQMESYNAFVSRLESRTDPFAARR